MGTCGSKAKAKDKKIKGGEASNAAKQQERQQQPVADRSNASEGSSGTGGATVRRNTSSPLLSDKAETVVEIPVPSQSPSPAAPVGVENKNAVDSTAASSIALTMDSPLSEDAANVSRQEETATSTGAAPGGDVNVDIHVDASMGTEEGTSETAALLRAHGPLDASSKLMNGESASDGLRDPRDTTAGATPNRGAAGTAWPNGAPLTFGRRGLDGGRGGGGVWPHPASAALRPPLREVEDDASGPPPFEWVAVPTRTNWERTQRVQGVANAYRRTNKSYSPGYTGGSSLYAGPTVTPGGLGSGHSWPRAHSLHAVPSQPLPVCASHPNAFYYRPLCPSPPAASTTPPAVPYYGCSVHRHSASTASSISSDESYSYSYSYSYSASSAGASDHVADAAAAAAPPQVPWSAGGVQRTYAAKSPPPYAGRPSVEAALSKGPYSATATSHSSSYRDPYRPIERATPEIDTTPVTYLFQTLMERPFGYHRPAAFQLDDATL